MRIGLIVPANIKYSPYVQYYTDILKKLNADYRIMSWDKAGAEEDVDMVFRYQTSDFDRKKVMIGHALFALKCKEYIRKEKIDHLIIFTIAPLFFLGYGYLRKFRGKIFMDVRDDSPFRRRFPKQLDRFGKLARTLVVSSPFYSEWFSRKSILCHNADLAMLERFKEEYGPDEITTPIRIAFAGMMIEEEINIEAVDRLKNDERFELIFIGRDNEKKEKIKEFVAENDIRNVVFEGEYKKDDIVDIYRNEADLVNILRQNTIINRNALPNKLYDAVLSGIPLLVYYHNEAIANYVNEYNLGIVLNEEEDLRDQIFRGIEEFDLERFKAGRMEFLKLVRDDHRLFARRLKKFCSK